MGMPTCDVMAFGAHPDDIELGCGGTLAKLAAMGRRVVLVDLTRGEMGTRGTAETRAQEAARAAEILGAAARENLALPDGKLAPNEQAIRRVVDVVRWYQPEVVFLPHDQDRHPDHGHASEIVYEGVFAAGLRRYETGQAAFRPSKLFYFMGFHTFETEFIVDITDYAELKLDAVAAYATQFDARVGSDPQTRLTAEGFWPSVEHRMGYFGAMIGARFGEGFRMRGMLAVDDPTTLNLSSF